jgi:ubiquinone/menaquinone biosynthesis C-methylase UbiE
MSVQPLIEKTAADAFAETMVGHLNSAAVMMMTGIGYRTGLFDMLAQLPPSTSDEIAAAARLDERYVREWLGAMTTARIVEYDEYERTYALPDAHAPSLTRANGPRNVAPMAQFLMACAKIEDGLVESFRNGGGVKYSDFPSIDRVMSDMTAPTRPGMIDPMLALAPGLTERLRAGIDVLDLGCGEGRSTLLLAHRFPQSRFRGIDLSVSAIERARAEVKHLRMANVEFEVGDAAQLSDRDRYGLVVTFDSIHDQADPARVLANIAAAMRPSGTYIMVEPDASSHLHENFEHPLGPLLYTFSTFHCMTVSLAENGEGLGTVWGREKATQYLNAAGFSRVRIENLPDDFFNAYFIASL